MRLSLILIKGKSEAWVDQAVSDYRSKISRFVNFEIVEIKSKKTERDLRETKLKFESEALLQKVGSNDVLILFDEKGKQLNSSIEFSKQLVKSFEMGRPKVSLVIGGPYGFSDEVRNRSNARWSLSGLTMNHHVAAIVALEQTYRALTIWKGIPYHNQ